jgi:hypothetical protein
MREIKLSGNRLIEKRIGQVGNELRCLEDLEMMPLAEALKRKFTLHGAELEYLEDQFRFVWRGEAEDKLPTVHGVYLLFSHGGTRLQKVGKADGKTGLRGRSRGYTSVKTEDKSERDATDRLWKTAMKKQLLGQRLSFYYFETPPAELPLPFALEARSPVPIMYNWARPLEMYLLALAQEEYRDQVGKTHLLLIGNSDLKHARLSPRSHETSP